jgi:hypothetical protein
VIDFPGLGELHGLISDLGSVHATVSGLGGPVHIAGDPKTLRQLAGSHRDTASTLRLTLDRSHLRVRDLTNGSWQGPTSGAFAHFWGEAHGAIDRLAASHDHMASSLDIVASRAERYNSDVLDAFGRIESFVGDASTAIGRLDVGSIWQLIEQGRALLSLWQRLLPELETFAGGLAGAVEADLGFSGPSATRTSIGPQQGPPINIPLPPLLRPPIGLPSLPRPPGPPDGIPPPPRPGRGQPPSGLPRWLAPPVGIGGGLIGGVLAAKGGKKGGQGGTGGKRGTGGNEGGSQPPARGGHTRGARPSTRGQHEKGEATRRQGQERTEKGDKKRKPFG